jgi:hypothetical protein
VDEVEVFTVMFEVASHAVFAVRIFHLNLRVVSVFGLQPLGNFLVAIEALKRGDARPKLVAARALCRAG